MRIRLALFAFSVFFFFFESSAQYDTVALRKDTTPVERQPLVLEENRITHDDQDVYRIKKGVDIPLTVAGVGWSLFAFTKIYSKDRSTAEQILALDRNDITAFNRPAIDEYSLKAYDNSNLTFYGSMPLPLLLLLDNKMRKDMFKLLFLYFEAMGVTGLLYTGSVYFHDKYRPYAYNNSLDVEYRRRGGAKNSFFAGHVALVGTSTFFMAKTISDYHPNSKFKWLFYTIASAATGATGYWRYKAGQHFMTDVLIGVGVGTLTGILVPHFHKNPLIKNPNLSIQPFVGQINGLNVSYRF